MTWVVEKVMFPSLRAKRSNLWSLQGNHLEIATSGLAGLAMTLEPFLNSLLCGFPKRS